MMFTVLLAIAAFILGMRTGISVGRRTVLRQLAAGTVRANHPTKQG